MNFFGGDMFNQIQGSGMLTGLEIKKQIERGTINITPFDESRINPNSYNLRLDKELKIYDQSFALDSHKENKTTTVIMPDDGYLLMPGILYIGRTMERTATNDFIPMINGRSSGGRLGLSIHICAGFGDIGFDGTWTLEITVVHPLIVYPGDEVAQVSFFTPAGSTNYKYNGRYQGQIDATPSRFNKEKTEESKVTRAFDEIEQKKYKLKLINAFGTHQFLTQNIDIMKAEVTTSLKDNETAEDGYKSNTGNISKTIYDDGFTRTENVGVWYEIGEERFYVRPQK